MHQGKGFQSVWWRARVDILTRVRGTWSFIFILKISLLPDTVSVVKVTGVATRWRG